MRPCHRYSGKFGREKKTSRTQTNTNKPHQYSIAQWMQWVYSVHTNTHTYLRMCLCRFFIVSFVLSFSVNHQYERQCVCVFAEKKRVRVHPTTTKNTKKGRKKTIQQLTVSPGTRHQEWYTLQSILPFFNIQLVFVPQHVWISLRNWNFSDLIELLYSLQATATKIRIKHINDI